MPLPKSRLKQAGLIEQIAEFLQIDTSVVFLDAAPLRDRKDRDHPRSDAEDAEHVRAQASRRYRKNTIRIWTLHMDEGEKDRIRGLKAEVKAIAAEANTKIAMSDRHPLNAAELEDRRRWCRGKTWTGRERIRREADRESAHE